MYEPMKKPTTEKEEIELKNIDSILFCSIINNDDNMILRFKNGTEIEVNRNNLVEIINQCSIGLMLESE